MAAFFSAKRDLLRERLAGSGLAMPPAQGSYFQLADYAPLGGDLAACNDVEFTERLINEAGVAVIPLSPFYREPPANMRIVRLCVAKRDETLVEAARRISEYTAGKARRGGAAMNFRLSIVQQPLAWQDAAANRAHFSAVLAPLAGTTDLVLLPEMFTTGFTMQPEVHAEAADGATRDWLLQQAQRARCRRGRQCRRERPGPLLQSFHARDAAGLTCTSTTSGTCSAWAGSIATTAPAATRRSSNGAASASVRWCVTTCGSRCGAGAARQLEYDLLTYCANWPAVRRHAWMTLLRARAIENQAFVAGVNRVGDDGTGVAHAGDSVVRGLRRPAAGRARRPHRRGHRRRSTSRRCAPGATSFPRIWMRMPLFSNRENTLET